MRMFKLFGGLKRNPASDEELALTDEQIEAEYFPGIVPIPPSDRAINLDALVACPDGDHWMVRGLDGLEVLVSGTPEQVNVDHLERAGLALSQIDKVAVLSTRLLQSFVHEPGSWSFDELNVGRDADHNHCDFQTSFSFSTSDGSNSYGYTSFVVCFRLAGSRKQAVHPFKTIIEFL